MRAIYFIAAALLCAGAALFLADPDLLASRPSTAALTETPSEPPKKSALIDGKLSSQNCVKIAECMDNARGSPLDWDKDMSVQGRLTALFKAVTRAVKRTN